MMRDGRQQPVFADSDPVDLAVQLTEVGKVSEYGPVRVGTRAEREASTAFPGCRWVQTDAGGGEFVWTGTGWASGEVASAVGTWEFPSTTNAGGYSIMDLGSYEYSDPTGLVSSWNDGGFVKVAKAGIYLVVANAATRYGNSPVTMHLGFLMGGRGLSEENLRGRSEVSNTGTSGACAVGATTVLTLDAGGRFRPHMNVSRNTQRPDGREFYVVLHRISAR